MTNGEQCAECPSDAGSAPPFALQQPPVLQGCCGAGSAGRREPRGAELRRAGSTAPRLGSCGKCWRAEALPGRPASSVSRGAVGNQAFSSCESRGQRDAQVLLEVPPDLCTRHPAPERFCRLPLGVGWCAQLLKPFH